MEPSVSNTNVWSNVLQSVEQQLNSQIFEAWFRPIKFDGCDDEAKVLRLKASQINKEWINSNYSDLLDQTLAELNLENYKLKWEILDADNEADRRLARPADQNASSEDEDTITFDPFYQKNQTRFVDLEPIENTLNRKYTFESFVVGSCNQFAHAAAEAVVDQPGKAYNPMFIYGGVGLGKTHLMHAIGHAIGLRNRHLRVAYISAEKFMNELINAIRYDKTQTFRDKYRLIDVLLMDDVQFMAGKERTQEEFFHTFNALHNDQKQIVITSDCPPREIPTLEERLHSRFEWGLIVDMEPPDLETKVAILKRKADTDGVELPDDIAFFMASKIKSNIRELEGSLVRLIAISSLRGLPISKMLAQDAMKNIIDSEQSESVTMERITKLVASHYKLTVEEIKSKNNSRAIAFPRQVAMYLCKRMTKHSFPEIGKEFGGKHHTTVMHSVDKIEKLVKEDKEFHKLVSELIDTLCS
ncbi:MAG: chromosomal replication initiator protein DnaA [Acidobacteria bacterium]|nr:MAG: chromosomal replication initiator protein DnaA [Acidobacteriota bacterium]REJ98427.1 MAG: chromosomal replication initiator protein DnaA [Acidobacteriota bacterium]REK17172.1 MAG: chromosomal replication initiator protein DnaA [Acidobacteriota bacterium]REK43083.1 MAG: chromosomal replication initiator protein DnaA [Acidobacteriota bacterium]